MPHIEQEELDDLEYSETKYSSIITSLVEAMDVTLTPEQVSAVLNKADGESEFDLISTCRCI